MANLAYEENNLAIHLTYFRSKIVDNFLLLPILATHIWNTNSKNIASGKNRIHIYFMYIWIFIQIHLYKIILHDCIYYNCQ
jgi:hypothetical protein